MTRRKKIQPKEDDPPDSLYMIIADAIESAAEAADEAGAEIRQIIYGSSGLGVVFAAAMDAVADTESGNIGPSVFDAAMSAASGAVADSAIPSVYDRMRLSVESIPDRLVRAAGQRAASDLLAGMSVQDRPVDDGRLLDKMKVAAVRAAKTRLKRDDAASAVRAATMDTGDIASIVIESASETIRVGAPVHAATVAVYEVAIRGVPPDDLAYAIKSACYNLPDVASRHDDMIATVVAALAMMIDDDGTYLRKYQTAVRRAKDMSRSEAADRIVDEVVGNTFEAVYMALVAGAYANSAGSAFESGYDKALAAAFGIDLDYNNKWGMSEILSSGHIPGVDREDLDLQREIANTMKILFGYKGDPARRKMLISAMDIDYKVAVSNGQVDGIISLYDMAYRAGYEGAGAVVGKKPRGARTAPQ